MNATEATFGKFKAGDVNIVIDDVAALAKQAGDKIMEIYNAPDFDDKIKDPKADGSPLTVADLEANKIIVDGLTRLYPSIPIITEEEKSADYDVRKDWAYFWCVDPLDGTKEFIKRNGEFTVNIGLVARDTPIAGVVYCPALEPPVMYKGNKFNADGSSGGPPVKEECDDVGGAAGYDSFKAIFPKTFCEDDEGLVLVASASHNSPETDTFCAKYKKHIRVSKGSSLKLLMVAEGSAHIYPRLAPTMEWDTCAAQAIVECAGGKVVQVAGNTKLDKESPGCCQPGQPVKYNKVNLLNPHFVVYGNVQLRKKNKKAQKEVAFGGSPKRRLLGSPAVIIVPILAVAAAYFAMQQR